MAGQDPDERLQGDGDSEDAFRRVDGAAPDENKQRKLDWISKASTEELTIPHTRARLIQEARDAGAAPDEIDDALHTPG